MLLMFNNVDMFSDVYRTFAAADAKKFSAGRTDVRCCRSPCVSCMVSVFVFLSNVGFALLLLVFGKGVGGFVRSTRLGFCFVYMSFFAVFVTF